MKSKIRKIQSFWSQTTKVCPTVFQVAFLCPHQGQSEFIDFTHKEILADETAINILCKPSNVEESVSQGGSIQSPWADDFEQAL